MISTRGPARDALTRHVPTEAALRARLQRSWYALFAHRTPLSAIERHAIGPLLDQRECLLVAAGGNGRLEALVAGAFEQIPRALPGGPLALLICPDKPTMRSAARRLTEPARRIELQVGVWSGLQAEPPKKKHVLVTTLRSLDALLTRHPATLKHLQWALVDRLNQFEGHARADQLSAVLYRLRKIAEAGGGHLTVAMASGSIADPQGAARRHLVDGQVIQVPPSRQRVDVQATPAPDLRTVVKALKDGGGRTIVYAPCARESEQLEMALKGKPPFGDAVYLRHGGTDERDAAKALRSFTARQTSVLITTLPVEDDVAEKLDRVVQWGPPPDVATLMARIGPKGRGPEDDDLPVMLLPRSLSEAVRMAFLVERASMDDWCVDPSGYHPGTMLQQACSLVFQNPRRRLTAKALKSRLPPWQSAWWTEADIESVLRRGHRWFKVDGAGGFLPTDRLLGRFEAGRIHGIATRPVATRQSMADAQAYLRFLGVPPGVGVLMPGRWVHGLGTVYGRIIARALSDLGEQRVDGHGGMEVRAYGRPPPLDVPRIRGVIRREADWLTKMTGQGVEFSWLPPAMKARALVETVSPEAVAEAWARLEWRSPDEKLGQRVNVALTCL